MAVFKVSLRLRLSYLVDKILGNKVLCSKVFDNHSPAARGHCDYTTWLVAKPLKDDKDLYSVEQVDSFYKTETLYGTPFKLFNTNYSFKVATVNGVQTTDLAYKDFPGKTVKTSFTLSEVKGIFDEFNKRSLENSKAYSGATKALPLSLLMYRP